LPSEHSRLSSCLHRLLPHLQVDSVAITGGVGIEIGLAALGRKGTRDRVVDLDLVAGSLSAVKASVAAQFLISHYHALGPGVRKFMIQLVDPETRIRVDVFPDLVGSVVDARTTRIGDESVLVLRLDRILDHKVQTLSRASRAAPVDPKHVRDARRLGAFLEILGWMEQPNGPLQPTSGVARSS